MVINETKRLAIRDIVNIVARYKISFAVIFISLSVLIGYSHYSFTVEKDIYRLNNQKNLLISQNFELKKDLTELSSPERVNSIAKKELGMVNVNYKQVKFLETK